jgi:hypothetical protein
VRERALEYIQLALAERLKRPVVIKNIADGWSKVGLNRAARSVADG